MRVRVNYPTHGSDSPAVILKRAHHVLQVAQYALALWQHAMQTGQWHGYSPRVASLEPPAWYLARAEEIDFDNLDERMNP